MWTNSGCTLLAACGLWLSGAGSLQAQATNPGSSGVVGDRDGELSFVVIVSRHGVRSPTAKPGQLDRYSRQPWPAWSVPPGNLTEHGAKLMTLFGAYDREMLAGEGLFDASRCDAAQHIRIVADSDQRTRETGNALAAGLAPGCTVPVKALPEGTADPLFHSIEAGVGQPDKALAVAAVSGRIGGNPAGLIEAYRPQLEELAAVLDSCDAAAPCPTERESIFKAASSIGPGKSDLLVELHSPLAAASTMAENILLEYTDGMDAPKVGWGKVDLSELRDLMQLHTAHEDIGQRPAYIARVQSSNLLAHVLDSMQQAVTAHPVAGALSLPGDRLLILVGHDTNLANMAGALGLNWLIDGRRDDTPPGGALEFELWKKHGTEEYFVRTYFTAQTLDQMRNATPLTAQRPPERVPVFVPGCGRADGACGWEAFQQTVRAAIDPSFVK